MQIVSIGDNMHDMSKPAVWEKYEKFYNMTSADKILPRVLSNIPLYVLFNPFTTTYRENGSANNVDPDEMAYCKQSHHYLYCLPFRFQILSNFLV